MSYEILLGLTIFAFVSSITPGPNNMMLLASGANFGFSRSIPHMLGIAIGFTVMLALVGIGLMQLFDAWPLSYQILKVASGLYLLWLAWKVAHAAAPKDAGARSTPMSFVQAALFQWVNPKAWTMALTAITLYAPSREITAVLMVAFIFGCTNLPAVSIWTFMGQKLQLFLTSQSRLTLFNWTMAILLILSLLPSFLN